jgi:hypothetical protein
VDEQTVQEVMQAPVAAEDTEDEPRQNEEQGKPQAEINSAV